MGEINFFEFIQSNIEKLKDPQQSKEVILNSMSHQILKWTVVNVGFIKNSIAEILPNIKSEYVIDRLVFQYFDCVFRESANFQAEDCISILEKELNRFNNYKLFPSHLMYSGALNMLGGKRELAYKYFMTSSFIANTYYLGLPRMYLGANSVNNSLDWVGSENKLPAIFKNIQNYSKISDSPCENLIFLSADSKYFNNFNEFVINNLSEFNSNVPLHFHVVDWDQVHIKFDIPTNLSFDIGFSFEKYRYLRDRTYFATARFYRAYEIMVKYGKNIYIGDIDNKFIREPDNFFNAVKGFDVGLRFNNNSSWFPWWGPSAGSFYVANSEYGRVFLKHLYEYISERFKVNQSKYTWWFDQLALNDVYEFCRKTYPEMRFVNLSESKYFLSVVRSDNFVQELKL